MKKNNDKLITKYIQIQKEVNKLKSYSKRKKLISKNK